MPTIKAKLSPIIEKAMDKNTSIETLNKLFAPLDSTQLEIIARSDNLSLNAQKLLSKNGTYDGILIQLYRNPTVDAEIKEALKKKLSMPTKIYVGFVSANTKGIKQNARKE